MAHASRSTSAPTAKVMRSAITAASPITRGPLAATSRGTLGRLAIHSMRLAVGWSPSPRASTDATSASALSANGTSSPRR